MLLQKILLIVCKILHRVSAYCCTECLWLRGCTDHMHNAAQYSMSTVHAACCIASLHAALICLCMTVQWIAWRCSNRWHSAALIVCMTLYLYPMSLFTFEISALWAGCGGGGHGLGGTTKKPLTVSSFRKRIWLFGGLRALGIYRRELWGTFPPPPSRLSKQLCHGQGDVLRMTCQSLKIQLC